MSNDDDRTDGDRRYDRAQYGGLIAVLLLMAIVTFLIGVAVYNEMRTPW